MPRLLAVNVGLPQNIQWRGETVHTGIWKRPVRGRCAARRLNLEGDGQGDLAGHGGEQRAVMVYQIDSYRYSERILDRGDFTFGQFSENFTVEGLPDHEVCIGDPRSEIVIALIVIRGKICSINFPRRRVFAQPRPNPDLGTAVETSVPCGP